MLGQSTINFVNVENIEQVPIYLHNRPYVSMYANKAPVTKPIPPPKKNRPPRPVKFDLAQCKNLPGPTFWPGHTEASPPSLTL